MKTIYKTMLVAPFLVGCGDDSIPLDDNLPEPVSVEDLAYQDISGKFNPINMEEPGNKNLQNKTDGEELTLFYRTNSWTMHGNDIKDLRG